MKRILYLFGIVAGAYLIRAGMRGALSPLWLKTESAGKGPAYEILSSILFYVFMAIIIFIGFICLKYGVRNLIGKITNSTKDNKRQYSDGNMMVASKMNTMIQKRPVGVIIFSCLFTIFLLSGLFFLVGFIIDMKSEVPAPDLSQMDIAFIIFNKSICTLFFALGAVGLWKLNEKCRMLVMLLYPIVLAIIFNYNVGNIRPLIVHGSVYLSMSFYLTHPKVKERFREIRGRK